MLVVTVQFEIEPDHAEAFRLSVRRNAADSLAREPGCSRFDVALDAERPERVFLYEIYEDRAAFDAHLETPHYIRFSEEVEAWVASKEVAFWRLEDWPLET